MKRIRLAGNQEIRIPQFPNFRISLFLICILGVLTFSSCVSSSHTNQVCFDKECFAVEIVADRESISKGLMHRESLSEKTGMLFAFPKPGVHHFWMKNTLIPLDIIWIDSTRHIIHIEHNVPPCTKDPCPSYGIEKVSAYVLEINAGEVKKLDLKVGDKANFDIFYRAEISKE